MSQYRKHVVAAFSLLMMVAGCGGGGSDQASSGVEHALKVGGGIEGTGAAAMIQLSAGATPTCGYDALHITIDRVRVNQNAAAQDGDAGWSEVTMVPPKRIDLTALSLGVLEPLGETSLPVGRYGQMRVVLVPNSPATPLANAVTPSGSTEVPLETPSAQQSGLKIDISLDLPAGTASRFALNFDGCTSVVKRGSSGVYSLKPVISVISLP